MDLYFCDICNESVPQLDLDSGTARRINGRVVCASCEVAMSHPDLEAAKGVGGGSSSADSGTAARASTAPRPAAPMSAPQLAPMTGIGAAPTVSFQAPPAPRSGSGALFLVAVMAAAALIVSSAVTVVLVERIQVSRRSVSEELTQVERRLTADERRLRDDLTRRIEDQRTSISTDLSGIRFDLRTQVAQSEKRASQLEARLEGLVTRTEQLAGLERDSEQTRAKIAEISSGLARLQRDVGVLAERWMEAIATGDVLEAEDDANGADELPDWLEHTARLSSPSAAERWSAVTALGDTQDERVVPYLVGMFEDPDIFVRMATARILEEIGSQDAIPSLIDALSDDEGVVREAVVAALRNITGQNLRYDPMAGEAERARRVKAWREWWKKM